MTALADNRNTPQLGGENPVAAFTVLASEICYAGGIAAADYTDEVQAAADTAGLKVVGRFKKKVDNTVDGHTAEVETGIFRYTNSSTYPVPRSAVGQVCYIEDDNIVAGFSTNLVSAGLVLDVDSDGVWVDQRPQALACAWERRPCTIVAKDDTGTVSAAVAFEGRTICLCDHTDAIATVTLPSAVAGMRVGFLRKVATAAHDVAVQCASGDKIQGSDTISAAGKKVDNTVDAVSATPIWFRAVDDTLWAIDNPVPADVGSWVKNDA